MAIRLKRVPETPVATRHLLDEEIALLVANPDAVEIAKELKAHIVECEQCILRVADACASGASQEDSMSGLRAVNLATARWKEQLGQADKDQWKGAALLGKSAPAEVGKADESKEDASDLLTLFVGRRQTKS